MHYYTAEWLAQFLPPYYYWMKNIKLVESFYQMKNIKWIGWLIFPNLFSKTSTIWSSSRFSVKLTLIDITTVIRYEQEVVKVQSHIYNFSCQFYKTQSSQFFFFTLTLFFLHFFSNTPADITTSIESQQPYDFKAFLLIKMSGVFQQVNGYMKCPHLGRSL